MTLREMSLLILLGALFGSAFLFLRIAAPAFGPAFLIDLRVFLAAGVLALWAVFIKEALRFRRPWKQWLWLGALNAAVPFTLIAWAELHITSSLAAILIATLPLFTALASALWLKEPFTLKKSLGLGLGLTGVAILSGWSPLALNGSSILAIGAVLLASLSYALGSIYAKRCFQGVPRVTLTVGNFVSAGMLLLPLAALTPPSHFPTSPALLALIGLVFIGTIVPYLLYFRVLERAGATAATSVAFLIPAFGALWGALVLAEPLNLAMFIGFIIVLFSVTLVNDLHVSFKGFRRSRARVEAASTSTSSLGTD